MFKGFEPTDITPTDKQLHPMDVSCANNSPWIWIQDSHLASLLSGQTLMTTGTAREQELPFDQNYSYNNNNIDSFINPNTTNTVNIVATVDHNNDDNISNNSPRTWSHYEFHNFSSLEPPVVAQLQDVPKTVNRTLDEPLHPSAKPEHQSRCTKHQNKDGIKSEGPENVSNGEDSKKKNNNRSSKASNNSRFIEGGAKPSIDMPYVSEAEKPLLAPPEHNCSNCDTRYTPMWRRIEGLFYCNKCALFFYRTGHHRPLTMGTNKNSKRRRRSQVADSENQTTKREAQRKRRNSSSSSSYTEAAPAGKRPRSRRNSKSKSNKSASCESSSPYPSKSPSGSTCSPAEETRPLQTLLQEQQDCQQPICRDHQVVSSETLSSFSIPDMMISPALSSSSSTSNMSLDYQQPLSPNSIISSFQRCSPPPLVTLNQFPAPVQQLNDWMYNTQHIDQSVYTVTMDQKTEDQDAQWTQLLNMLLQ